MRAQVSIETLVVIALVLIVVLVIVSAISPLATILNQPKMNETRLIEKDYWALGIGNSSYRRFQYARDD